MDDKTTQITSFLSDEIEKQFAYVDSIINWHRTRAIATVNMESLLTAWEVGQLCNCRLHKLKMPMERMKLCSCQLHKLIVL